MTTKTLINALVLANAIKDRLNLKYGSMMTSRFQPGHSYEEDLIDEEYHFLRKILNEVVKIPFDQDVIVWDKTIQLLEENIKHVKEYSV